MKLNINDRHIEVIKKWLFSLKFTDDLNFIWDSIDSQEIYLLGSIFPFTDNRIKLSLYRILYIDNLNKYKGENLKLCVKVNNDLFELYSKKYMIGEKIIDYNKLYLALTDISDELNYLKKSSICNVCNETVLKPLCEYKDLCKKCYCLYTIKDKDLLCPICLEVGEGVWVKLNCACKDFFHRQCLDKHLNTKDNCPTCREKHNNLIYY
jgi:hypothetical protein